MLVDMVISLLLLGTGFAYPCYMTLLALEGGEPGKMTLWLNYWVAQSLMTLLLASPVGLLIMWLIPASSLLQVAANVWLWHPSFEGAKSLVDMLEGAEKKSPKAREFTTAAKKYIEVVLDVCRHFVQTAGAVQQQTQQM